MQCFMSVSSTEPCCIPGKDCGAIPVVAWGTGTTSGSTEYQANVTYVCNEGYELANPSADKMFCNSSGLWDWEAPICQSK